MLVIPVIELSHGKCVHTHHENEYVEQLVTEDPLTLVESWVNDGAKRIHIVDVDAIRSGEPENISAVRKIKQHFPQLCVQVSGGINNYDNALVWLDANADFLVLNSKSLRKKDFIEDLCAEFPDKILVSLDCRGGQIMMGSNGQGLPVTSIVERLDEAGVTAVVLTDVPEKGHVNGKNILAVNALADGLTIPVFTNGGLITLEELGDFSKARHERMEGILLGRPLHEKFFSLADAHLATQH